MIEEVDLARVVLGVSGVELHDLLDLKEGLDVSGDGVPDDIPGDSLGARRSGKRSSILID